MKIKLHIGLLLENRALQASYQQLIVETGCTVSVALSSSSQFEHEKVSVDAWLVVLESEIDNPRIGAWLQNLAVPVLFDDGLLRSTEGWQRRLTEKLQQLDGMINLAVAHEPPKAVWVLAASTGGPAAVKSFLQQLPPALNVAFVYAQHIDHRFDVTLAQVVSRGSHYPAVLACHGSLLAANSVLIVRPEQQAEVQKNGTLVVQDTPWAGVYKPAINQVVANVASVYGSKSGVIVFTGMGDDGKAAARLMKQQGGKVWVQSSESCTVSSMPDEVKSTGVVSYEGTPEELALALVEELALLK